MPDLTPLEAAEMLEDIAAVSDLKAVDGKRSGLVKIGRIDAEDLRIAASCLRKIASGEYTSVVHGRWIPKDFSIDYQHFVHSVCSNCGNDIKFDAPTKFCSRCGARMDDPAQSQRGGDPHDPR